jgi:hypothetical protein
VLALVLQECRQLPKLLALQEYQLQLAPLAKHLHRRCKKLERSWHHIP